MAQGYILTTKSGSVYTVASKEGTPYQTLSGGKLPYSLEIEYTNYCMANSPWRCQVTKNPENKAYAGTLFQTSIVDKVRVFDTDKAKRRLPNVPESDGMDQYGNSYDGLY